MTRRRLTGMNAKDGEAIPKPSRHSTDSCSNHGAAGNDRRCHARWLFMLSARPSAGATIVKVGLLALDCGGLAASSRRQEQGRACPRPA